MSWFQRTGFAVLVVVMFSCPGCDSGDRSLLGENSISGTWVSTNGEYQTTLDLNGTKSRVTGTATSTDPDWAGQTYSVSGSFNGRTIALTIKGNATGDIHVVGTVSNDQINGTITQNNVSGQGPFVATKE